MGGRGWTRTIDPLVKTSRSLLSYPPGTSLPYSHEPGRENSLKIMQSHIPADPGGFEPPSAVLETAMLPLHHRPM